METLYILQRVVPKDEDVVKLYIPLVQCQCVLPRTLGHDESGTVISR